MAAPLWLLENLEDGLGRNKLVLSHRLDAMIVLVSLSKRTAFRPSSLSLMNLLLLLYVIFFLIVVLVRGPCILFELFWTRFDEKISFNLFFFFFFFSLL